MGGRSPESLVRVLRTRTSRHTRFWRENGFVRKQFSDDGYRCTNLARMTFRTVRLGRVIFAYREMIDRGPPTLEKCLMTISILLIVCYFSRALMWHRCRAPNTNGRMGGGPPGYSRHPGRRWYAPGPAGRRSRSEIPAYAYCRHVPLCVVNAKRRTFSMGSTRCGGHGHVLTGHGSVTSTITTNNGKQILCARACVDRLSSEITTYRIVDRKEVMIMSTPYAIAFPHHLVVTWSRSIIIFFFETPTNPVWSPWPNAPKSFRFRTLIQVNENKNACFSGRIFPINTRKHRQCNISPQKLQLIFERKRFWKNSVWVPALAGHAFDQVLIIVGKCL